MHITTGGNRRETYHALRGAIGTLGWKAALISILFFFCLISTVKAMDISLEWDPNTESDLAGYKVYYKAGSSGEPYDGTDASQGASPITVAIGDLGDPNDPQYTLTGLDENKVYFLVVTAYDTEGMESDYSNEVVTVSISFPDNGFYIDANEYTSYTVSGMAGPSASVEIFAGLTSLGTTTALTDGSWTKQVDFTSVSEGAISLTAEADGTTSHAVTGTLNTDPNDIDTDTDNDDLPDAWEVNYGLDPLDATGSNGKYGDFDGDGWTNYEEYLGGLNPADEGSYPASPPSEMKEVIPHAGAGISDDTRVPNDTSFSVRIEDPDGIDITDTQSIAFTIDDGVNEIYRRDLSDSGVVRVVKLTTDQDTKVTRLWVVYDRCEEEGLGCYLYDASVNIKVDAKDSTQDWMIGASYDFAIESMSEHEEAQTPDNLPDTYEISPDDPDLADSQYSYDAGIQVMSGDLEGAKIIYNSSEPVTPRFGPIGELSGLGMPVESMPLDLQPPTVFNTPVKIFIPYPGDTDVSELSIFFYNGTQWVMGCDADGNVQPDGEGWMVPGSRQDHPDADPPTIEIKVYHFSGVQLGGDSTSTGDNPVAGSSVGEATSASAGDSGGGGCFIMAASNGIPFDNVSILLLMLSLVAGGLAGMMFDHSEMNGGNYAGKVILKRT